MMLLAGCASYEHAIVEPAQFSQTIGKEEVRMAREPVEYRFRQIDQRLGMRIANPGDAPITLKGEKSYVVDAEGETHTINGQTIAPRSFITMGLPPLARVYRSGPRVGVGVGVGSYSSHSHLGGGLYDPFYDGPVDIYEVHDAGEHWIWKTGQIRLRLVFESEDGASVQHDWLLDRRKRDNQ